MKRSGGNKMIAVMLLVACVAAGGGCQERPAKTHYHADALKLDSRYIQVIHFTNLGLRIPLPSNVYVRMDPPVEEPRDHIHHILKELGVTTTNVAYTNPAKNGGQMHLRFRDGKECSFIWVKRDADARLAGITLEHEKYHAVCRLAPEAVASLSAAISRLGFRLNLSEQDEEFAATLVQVLSLHLQGIALEEIGGSDLVQQATQLLRKSQADPSGRKPANPVDNLRVNIQWPHGRDVIEIPLEFLDEIPIVRCQINGKPAILYLDTGAQPISLYQDRLARFGIQTAGETNYPRYTASGFVEKTAFSGEFRLAFKDDLSLQVSGGPCLSGSGRNPNHDVDGLLGITVIRKLNAVIDLRAAKLILALEKSSPKVSSPN